MIVIEIMFLSSLLVLVFGMLFILIYNCALIAPLQFIGHYHSNLEEEWRLTAVIFTKTKTSSLSTIKLLLLLLCKFKS